MRSEGERASLRREAVLVACAALTSAAVWAGVHGHWWAGAWFLLPGHLAETFALPLALSTLRRRRALAAAAFAGTAGLAPLLAYWERFPYLVGQIPPLSQLGPADALSGLPCAAFGLLLLRRPRPAGGVPGPSALLDAGQAVLAACLLGILASAVSRGGQFGLGYFAASLALMAGLFKAAVVKGALAAVATLVVARGSRSRGHLAAAFAFAVAAAGPTCLAAPEAGLAWGAGFALTLIARFSRRLRLPRRGRATAALPA